MTPPDDAISYQPSDGLSYDPNEEKYWDARAAREETQRVFEVCHGCRMCFKFCDSFPTLFDAVDAVDGRVAAVGEDVTRAVVDSCFQCKLCEVQCPYTPREGHEFQLDFPKLVHRLRAIRARDEGVGLRDRVLGDPDRAGRFARASLGMANRMNRVRAHRWLLEKALGIHRDKDLPDFASTTFDSWASREAGLSTEPGGEAVLFPTCFVQNNDPALGRDTVEVFQRNGIDLRYAPGLGCCGMPAWEHGDLDTVRSLAARNREILLPYVRAGARVVAINPTCSMMLRRELPELVEPDVGDAASEIAEATRDPGEFLWEIRDEERFCTDFRSSPKTIAYHAPCHLRAQSVGFRGRDLLKKLPGVERVAPVMQCCGHDGTFAMRVEGFETSRRIGERAFTGMSDASADLWATDCPLAAIQFRQHAGKLPLHPMSILARAYRGDPFPDEEETSG